MHAWYRNIIIYWSSSLDKACLDLIYKSEEPGKKELIERIESKLGPYILDCAEKLGLGKKEYELIDVDK